MSPPSRSTPAGRAYLDLQKLARVNGRPVQELFQLYILEAFLDRLSQSSHRDRMILKGGVLLAAFGERRPTRDVDLQAQSVANDADNVRRIISEIARISIDDGVEFEAESSTADTIRDDEVYAGVRVSVPATLLTARLPFHVDVNVGDPITPGPQEVSVPRLLGGEILVLGYGVGMVHAEKIVTAITRGTTNTRWRDFVDIFLLAGRHVIEGHNLMRSLRSVATHRETDLVALAILLDGYAEMAQPRWSAWRQKQQLEGRVPESFGDILAAVIDFADPAVIGTADGFTWDPMSWSWR